MQASLARTQNIKCIVERPVRYYLDDRAFNTLVVYGVIKVIVLAGALLVSLVATRWHFMASFPVFPSSLTNWDGQWYISIARSWYAEGYPNSAAWPPLYPLLIKLLSFNQSAAMPWTAVIIANAFSFIALYFLYRLVPLVIDERYRLRVCLAFMVFPILVVSTLIAYSEAMFLALTIGAYYYWKRSKFGLAAILAIGSVFTRQVGVLILIVFVIDAIYEHWSQRNANRLRSQLMVVGATAIGIGMLYLFYYLRFGDPFIVSQVEAANWKLIFTLRRVPENIAFSFFGIGLRSMNPFAPTLVPLIILGASALIGTAIYLFRRHTGLALYTLASLALFLSATTTLSYLRYVAATFPLYLFFGFMLSDDWRKNIAIGTVAVLIAVENLYIWLSGWLLY